MPQSRRTRTEGGTFFFTVVTYERRPLLCLESSREVMKRVVKSVADEHPFVIDAWVLLPDHIHCLWTLPEGDNDFSIRWALIKREFTRSLSRVGSAHQAAATRDSRVGSAHQSNLEAASSLSRERHREGTVWQRRFWEHQIRDGEDYAAHMDYIHFNPVKHGLVKSPEDWPYSTFHRWVARGLYDSAWGSSGALKLAPGVGRE